MKALQKYVLLAALAGAVLAGCREDDEAAECPCDDPNNPECPNYDPCWDVDEPHAGFTLEEFMLAMQEWISAGDDSVFVNEIRYSALHQGPGITHKWYLGAEVIEEPTFTRSHASVPLTQRPTFITVSHVMEYPLDNPCYQREVGRDSTSRTYYLIKYWNEFATRGRFRCAFENQTDSFDIRIGVYDNDGNDAMAFTNFVNSIGVNFHNLGDSTILSHASLNSLLFLTGTASASPRGFMRPTEISGLYKMEYRLYLEDFTVYARKLD